MIEKRKGNLEVVRRLEGSKLRIKCDCGNYFTIRVDNWNIRKKLHCSKCKGEIEKFIDPNEFIKHDRVYKIWKRLYNVERGLCPEWKDFLTFRLWYDDNYKKGMKLYRHFPQRPNCYENSSLAYKRDTSDFAVLDEYIPIREVGYEFGSSIILDEDYISVEDAIEYGDMRVIRNEKGRKKVIR
jgi:hypothetical protein